MKVQPEAGFLNRYSNKKTNQKKSILCRVTTAATVFFVLINQVVPVSLFAAATGELPSSLEQGYGPVRVAAPEEIAIRTGQPQLIADRETSLDYLQNDLLLKRVTVQPEGQTEESKSLVSAGDGNASASSALAEAGSGADQTDYSFSGALQFLKQQTSNLKAAVVKNVTKENLLALARLPYEVGLAVVDGIVMMFTSYQADNLNGTSALKQILDSFRTGFLMHFQPHTAEPSLADREGAADRGSRVEHTASLKAGGSGDLDVFEYSASEESVRVIESDELIARIEREQKSEILPEQLSVLAQEIKTALQGPAERYRSEPPTVFSGEPTVGSFASTSPFATANVVQTSAEVFRINYNVSNSGSFAGGSINFSTPVNVSSLSKFTFEMLTNNTCGATGGNCLKLEVIDSANRKASVFVRGLSTAYQQVDILFSTLQQSRPDLDFTQIKGINFVEDYPMASPKNGYLQIKSGGLAFTPTISAAPYSQTALTSLPGLPVIGSGKGDVNNNATVTTTQTSAQDFSMTYNLTDAADFGFTTLNFSSSQNLSSGVVLAAALPAGKKIKVEVKDVNGKIGDYYLLGTGTKQNYTLTLTGTDLPAGFNKAQISMITFVADQANAGVNGVLTVETKGLDYIPALTGTTYTQSALTNLPGYPVIGSGKGDADNDSSVVTSQTNAQNFSMTYALTDAADFAFTFLNFSVPQNLSSGIVLAASVPTGKKIKVEVKDVTGKIADYYLIGTGAKLNYTLSLTGTHLPAGFDKTQISLVTFVADPALSGFNGNLAVETKGLDYVRDLTGTTYTQSALTNLPGYPVVGSGKGDANNNSTVTTTQTSAQDFSMAYTLTDAADFGFTSLNFTPPQSLSSGVVFAATVASGKKIKVEVKDVTGKIADYYLLGTGAKLNYTLSLTGTDVPTGFAKTQISTITFVADKANAGASGMLTVETKKLGYTPVLTGTTYTQSAITNLPGYPVVGSGKGDANNNSTVTTTQTSAQDFSMAYALTDAADFGFTSLNFTPPQSLSSGVVFAAKVASGKKIKVEVKDVTGNIADYYLLGTGAKLNYTLSLTGTDVPTGFDKTQISTITFVADKANAGASGTLTVETKKLDYVRALTGTVYTQSALTNLPGYPVIGSGKGDANNNSTVTTTQTSAQNFSMAYTLTDAADFGFTSLSFTPRQSLSSGVVFAATVASGKKIKVEVKDVNGKIADYYLIGTGAKLNYTLSLTGTDVPTGFDKTQISLITFVADKVNAGATGTLTVETKKLDYIPALTGTTYTQSALTNLPGYPVVGSGKGDANNNSTVTTAQTSAQNFSMAYTLTDAADFGFTSLTFPTPQSLSSGVVFAATVASGKKIKVEVKDVNGKIADYYLIGTGAKLNYTLSLTGTDVPTGFDKTQISLITFVADKANAGAAGTLAVETKKLDYTPVLSGTVYTQSTITNLPGYPVVGSGKGDANNNSTVTTNQTSARNVSMTYALTDAADFGFTSLSFPTPQSLSSGVVFAATVASGKKIKVEVKDVNGKIADYYLSGTGSKLNYTLSLTGSDVPTGFDKTQISLITFVADQANAGASGTLAVETKGLSYTPVVPGQTYNAAAITQLPNTPVLSAGENDPDADADVTVDQPSASQFTLNYNLPDAADFGFARIAFDTPESFTQLTFAANFGVGKRMKVEVKDANGIKVSFWLNGGGAMLNYPLSLIGEHVPTGFAANMITEIVFVADPASMGSSGSVSIETKGLDYIPVINP